MEKRVKEIILSLAFIIIACGFYGGEVKAETSGDWEYSVNENEVTITKYIGTDTEVVIPDKIDGKSVTCIGDSAFSGCRSLTSIEIPNSVTSICGYAFRHCESLTSIEIPNSVTSIDGVAFSWCSSLSSIKVDYGNSKYDSRNDCNAIIETKSGNLIAGCKNTVIPEGVTSLENNAFEGCTSLTSIEIPNSVTRIMCLVFWNCTSLTSVEIPDSVKSIGNNAFWGCSGLTSIKVDSENSIYDSRNGCNAIIEKESGKLIVGCINTDIPEDVTSIGDSAFWGCSSLTGIEIPNSVTSIGNQAFECCYSLTSIEIPNKVTSIGGSAFEFCSSLTSIEIPNKVTSIGGSAFEFCSSLTSIGIPNSVTSIGNNIFEYCDNLKTVYAGSSYAEQYMADNYPNISVFSYEINDDEVTITKYSGSDKNVVIPETIEGKPVTKIGDSSFEYCESLTTIKIPNGVTSIESFAFWGCNSLTSIEIPDSVTCIGDRILFYCGSLTSIKVDSENLIYDSRNNCNALIETKSGKLIVGCSKTVIPEDVTSIENFAFADYKNLESISIPNGLISIGESAFFNCISLTNIEIPSSVTSIGGCAFSGCSGLTSIKVDSGNKKYDSRNNCNAIIEKDSNRLILGCGNTIIPKDVTSIGDSSFEWALGLTNIEIPNSVTSIGENAFDGCANAKFYVEKGSYAEKYLKDNGIKYTYKHTPEIDPKVKQTCTKTGLTEGSHCAICGEIIVKQKIVPADGHKWDEGKVTKEPTETEKGIKTFTCSVCKETKTEEIPAKGKTEPDKSDDKKEDQSSKDKSKSKPVKKAGIGTISADGKTLTDTDGTKYLVAEKIKNKQLKKKANIADKKSAGKYKITKITKKKGKITGGTVTYMKPYNKNCKTANIKSSVKIAGATFKVTVLNKNAFKNCKKLTKVTIGKNVTQIGKNAFNGCKKLKTVNINATNLKKVGAKAFKGINTKAKFKLYKKKFNKYKKLIKKAKAPATSKYTK